MANTYNNILRAGTQAAYNAISVKDNSVLYFCTDTGKLYKGSVDFTDSMVVAASKPATPIAGKIYFLADTNTVEVYVSGAWKVISYPAATTVDATSDDVHVATAKAVYDAIQQAVEDLASSANVVKSITNGTADAELTVTKGDGATSTVTVKGVVTTPTWDSTARKLTLPVAGGTDVEVNIGKDIFVDPTAENKYNPDTKCIEIYLNDGTDDKASTKISIPAAGLIDTYAGEATNSATAEVTADNKIKVNVKLDPDSKNAIVETAAGLKVDLTAYALTATVDEQISTVQDAVDAAQADATDALAQLTTLKGNAASAGSIDNKIATAKTEMTGVTTALDGRVTNLEGRMDNTEDATGVNTDNIAALATAAAWGTF